MQSLYENSFQLGCLAGVLVAGSVVAQAQLTSIGPFIGNESEGFESWYTGWTTITTYGGAFVMNGAALLYAGTEAMNALGTTAARPTESDLLGSSGTAKAADGVYYAYIAASPNIIRLDFGTPITEFGGYWGTYTGGAFNEPQVFSFEFFDSPTHSIGGDSFEYSRAPGGDGHLVWRGWRFPSAVNRVVLTTQMQVMADGLQATAVPEPRSTVTGACMILLFTLGHRYWNRAKSISDGRTA